MLCDNVPEAGSHNPDHRVATGLCGEAGEEVRLPSINGFWVRAL